MCDECVRQAEQDEGELELERLRVRVKELAEALTSICLMGGIAVPKSGKRTANPWVERAQARVALRLGKECMHPEGNRVWLSECCGDGYVADLSEDRLGFCVRCREGTLFELVCNLYEKPICEIKGIEVANA